MVAFLLSCYFRCCTIPWSGDSEGDYRVGPTLHDASQRIVLNETFQWPLSLAAVWEYYYARIWYYHRQRYLGAVEANF